MNAQNHIAHLACLTHMCVSVCVTFHFNYKRVPATSFLEFTMSPVSLIKNEKKKKSLTPALHDGNTERGVGNELLLESQKQEAIKEALRSTVGCS